MRILIASVAIAALRWVSTSDAETRVHRLSKQEIASCKARGGKPEMVLSFVESCVWPTRDSGQACRDKSECEGHCEAPLGTRDGTRLTGTCSKTGSDRLGGCWNLVERGRSRGDICVD